MCVGHITIPFLFKFHKMVPQLAPNRFQVRTSSGIGHPEKAFVGKSGFVSHTKHTKEATNMDLHHS